MENKICLFCKREIVYEEWLDKFKHRETKGKPSGISLASIWWRNKKYCSKECNRKHNMQQEKDCGHCGKRFNRNAYDSNNAWEKRRFCGKDCALEWGFINSIAKRMNIKTDVLKKELIIIAEKYAK